MSLDDIDRKSLLQESKKSLLTPLSEFMPEVFKEPLNDDEFYQRELEAEIRAEAAEVTRQIRLDHINETDEPLPE